MEIIRLEKINFSCEDLISSVKKSRGDLGAETEISSAAAAAFTSGLKLVDLRAAVGIYDNEEVRPGSETISIILPDGNGVAEIHTGVRTSYLVPARKSVIAICTAGTPIVRAIESYSEDRESLTGHCLSVFAILALEEMAACVRKRAEAVASGKNWGVGPAMQPGSVIGWDISGQKELYLLAHGELIDVSIDGSSFLSPYMSNSMMIGMGPGYRDKTVGSLCHECPRCGECLWRRDRIK